MHVKRNAKQTQLCSGLLLAVVAGCSSESYSPVGLRPLAPPEVSMRVNDTIGLEVTLTRAQAPEETITVQVGGTETCVGAEEPTPQCVISADPYPLIFTEATGDQIVSVIRGVATTNDVYLSIPVQIVDVLPDNGWAESGAILARTWRVRITD